MTQWGESCGFTVTLTPVHSHIYLESGMIVVQSSDSADVGEYSMTLKLQSSEYASYLPASEYNFQVSITFDECSASLTIE